jgi:hypothetical protein
MHAVVYTLDERGGFFSSFFFLCEAYLYAKKQGLPFFVDSSRWIYGRWHTFFQTLQEWDNGFSSPFTERESPSHVKGLGSCQDLWKEGKSLGFSHMYSKIVTCNHNDLRSIGRFVENGGIRILCTNSLKEYIDSVAEIFVLKEELQIRIQEEAYRLGPYKALFVRRGDKIISGEAEHVSLSTILSQTNFVSEDTIYVQSDDYTVVEEMQTMFPNVRHTINSDQRGSIHEEFIKLSEDDRIAHTKGMLIGLGLCGKAMECWTDETSNVGRFLKLAFFETTYLYMSDQTAIYQPKEELTCCPAYRAVFKACKEDIFLFPYDNMFVSHKCYKPKPPIGFIVIRHMNSNTSMEYWWTCYQSIRNLYPHEPIVIIDDHSNPQYLQHPTNMLRQANLSNTRIEYSDRVLRGELLAYVYFQSEAYFDKAVILHDSVFLQSRLPIEEVETARFLWHFKHTWDTPEKEREILEDVGNPAVVDLHRQQSEWHGCFGVMSIITLKAIMNIDIQYNFFTNASLLERIQTREDRMCVERVFAVLLTHLYPELRDTPSLFGDIHEYYKDLIVHPCSYKYHEYLQDKRFGKNNRYPAIKVFTGR